MGRTAIQQGQRSRTVDPAPEWTEWSDEQLLDLRMRDLRLGLQGNFYEEPIAQLHRELQARGLPFRPHVWLSDEWFTPDGVPGIAVPFYLAHPRLAKLEASQMLEVEGGTTDWCMRILRHEAGHAIENAYLLRRRRRRQKLFGRSSQPYPTYYTPRPYSRSFVHHLDVWYAQSHPDEDFAETFAVWLDPGSLWKERYRGWPVMKKLEFMERLMDELAGTAPIVTGRQQVDPLPRMYKTLRDHYEEKRKHYGIGRTPSYDTDLRKLFSDAPAYAKNQTAAEFLHRTRKETRRRVAEWTGEYQYTIDQVLEGMIERCQALKLHLTLQKEQAKLDFAILLTVQTMNFLHSGRHKVAL
ncbi:MAG: putative zinc-binding metallopeptidase [Nitrospira sp.]|nr:putative zinc-binding metallopeptidase [Nitrospira sp.]